MTSGTPFSELPRGVDERVQPFELYIEEQKLQDMKTLLRLSPLAKETYENVQDAGSHGEFGVSREWIAKTKKFWEDEYDWRAEESHINTFPNYTTTIDDTESSTTFTIHFTALFSSKPDAIPIAFYHGWPGSFLEFLPLLTLLKGQYTPENLPFHIIIPSLPGFTLSSAPPLVHDWGVSDTARIMHALMIQLGFTSPQSKGYLVQGGDIGSFIARAVASTYPECKGMHINMMEAHDISTYSRADDILTNQETQDLHRREKFFSHGHAYAKMHGTKPSTIGLVLSSSPLALLSWIAEKFLAWSDQRHTPSLTTMLNDITLYWLTNCFPTSIYTYREDKEIAYVDKPVGYSYFPYEIAPVPRAWAERTGQVTFFKAHERGGHFAALERPETLWNDVEEWVKTVNMN